MMKVVLVSHSDLIGGASVVTYRLMHALRSEGIDARMLVFNKVSDDDNIVQVGSSNSRKFHFLAERARIAVANGFSRKNLFKVSIANSGLNLHTHPLILEADVIVLNWINQGLLSLDGISKLCRLNKPIVWTMHDMWCLTGICHHAYECTRYSQQCGKCPFLIGNNPHDLSYKTWKKKKNLFDNNRITFVSVSHWLAECSRISPLLSPKCDIRVIHNAFPADSFTTHPDKTITALQAAPGKNLIIMGAARLDDPIKGLDYAIDALNYLSDNNKYISSSSLAIFFGSIRNRAILDRLRFPHVFLDHISDPELLRNIYAGSKVVLSTSLYETLPGTLIEGQASGCLPVTFGRGGQSDIVTHLKDGYIAKYKDSRDIAEGIIWALNQNPDREKLHESVINRFASSHIARQYISLFHELLNR